MLLRTFSQIIPSLRGFKASECLVSATFVPACVLLTFIVPPNKLHYVTHRKEQKKKQNKKVPNQAGKILSFPLTC